MEAARPKMTKTPRDPKVRRPPASGLRRTQRRPNGFWPAVLVIVDGFGYAPAGPGNAITLATTPVFERLYARSPWTTLGASGSAVGLPDGQEGNSEAGHINLAAGRIVEQDAIVISRQINDGRFFKNPTFLQALRHAMKHRSHLHIMGLLSNGQSAHSHPDHLIALLAFFREQKVSKVFLHLFTDGRDSPPRSAFGMMEQLEKTLRPNEIVASVTGRFWAMDRKKEWSRTIRTFKALALGLGHHALSGVDAISQAYAKGRTDEFIEPTVVIARGKPVGPIRDRDAVIFFNLRSDRARQLTKFFVQERPKEFQRPKRFRSLFFVAMTDFGPDLENVVTAYPSPNLTGTLPMALRQLRQLYIAESEKFAHVTYFLNGGYADPVAGEARVMVPSPSVASYDLKPEMASQAITDLVIGYLQAGVYDFVALNYASPDMVAHTGNLKATIAAVESVDRCLGQLVTCVRKRKGVVFITGDHGNAEGLLNPATGATDTEHSTAPVPFLVASPTIPKSRKLRSDGVLAQVAPTILKTLGLPIPPEMILPPLWQR